MIDQTLILPLSKCPDATEKDWNTITEIIDNADTLLEIDCVRIDEISQTLLDNITRDKVTLFTRNTTLGNALDRLQEALHETSAAKGIHIDATIQ